MSQIYEQSHAIKFSKTARPYSWNSSSICHGWAININISIITLIQNMQRALWELKLKLKSLIPYTILGPMQ